MRRLVLAAVCLAALVGAAACGGTGATAPDSRWVALDPVIVNLADPGGHRYLRTALSLECGDEKTAKEIERAESRICDAVIRVLRSKTAAELAPARMEELRRELAEAVNGALGRNAVAGVYFEEFITQ